MTVEHEIGRLTGGFSGTFGMWARCLDTGETLTANSQAEFPSASVVKVAILYELYRQALARQVNLDAILTLRPEDVVPGDGVLKEFAQPVTLSVRNAAALMIVISDNTASNLLIDLLDREAVNRAMSDLGLPQIRLENKFYRGVQGAPINRGTPAAFGQLLEGIARRDLLAPAACAEILQILERQHFKDQVTRFLPEPEADQAVIASKMGDIRGVRNELAFVRSRGRSFVLCMMSRGCADLRYHPDNEASILLPRVAAVVYAHYTQT